MFLVSHTETSYIPEPSNSRAGMWPELAHQLFCFCIHFEFVPNIHIILVLAWQKTQILHSRRCTVKSFWHILFSDHFKLTPICHITHTIVSMWCSGKNKQRHKKTTTWQCFGKDSWRLISLRRISDLDLEPSWDVHAVIRCAVALLVSYSCRRISITANPNGVPSRHKRAGSYSVRDVMHFLIRFKEGRGISRSEQISCRRLEWWPEQHSSRQDEQFGMKWN